MTYVDSEKSEDSVLLDIMPGTVREPGNITCLIFWQGVADSEILCAFWAHTS